MLTAPHTAESPDPLFPVIVARKVELHVAARDWQMARKVIDAAEAEARELDKRRPLERTVGELPLSPTVATLLGNAEIHTLEDLAEFTPAEVARLRHVTTAHVDELQAALAEARIEWPTKPHRRKSPIV